MKTKNINKLFLLSIILLAILIRLYPSNALSLWYDESFSIILAKKDLGNLLEIAKADVHPPLYYILLHFWLNIVMFPRLFSVLFSIVSIILTYLIAKKAFGERIALLTSFFLSISPMSVHYSSEIRMYSLLLFFSLTATYFLLRFVSDKKNLNAVFYVFFSVCAYYTHYYALFSIVAQLIYLISINAYHKNFIKRLKIALVLGCSILVLYVPWIKYFFTHTITSTGSGAHALPHSTNLDNIANIILIFFLGEAKGLPLKTIFYFLYNYRLESIYFLLILLLFILPLIYSILLIRKKESDNNNEKICIVFSTIIPLFLSGILIFIGGRFYPRNLLIILPFYLMLLSYSILSVKRIWIRFSLTLLITYCLLTSTIRYHKYFVRDVTFNVSYYLKYHENLKNSAIFCTNPFTFFPLKIYFNSKNIYLLMTEKVTYINLLTTNKKEIISDKNFLKQFSSVWIILSEWSVDDHLKEELKLVEKRWLDEKEWHKESEYPIGSVKRILMVKYNQIRYTK